MVTLQFDTLISTMLFEHPRSPRLNVCDRFAFRLSSFGGTSVRVLGLQKAAFLTWTGVTI